MTYNDSSMKIVIRCFSETETEECFTDECKMIHRYKSIKKMIGA